ncbi:MAG: hypothetical protein WC861_01565 [Candidatus Micrarchaeia archaeon]|jgi:hypothetical protein
MQKLPYPFSYYWKAYAEGKCPFCDSKDFVDSSDIVFCSGYEMGGYLLKAECDTFASDGDGQCKYCRDGDFADREMVKGAIFLCRDCEHGVNFKDKTIFANIFTSHNPKKCKYCEWHSKKTANKDNDK